MTILGRLVLFRSEEGMRRKEKDDESKLCKHQWMNGENHLFDQMEEKFYIAFQVGYHLLSFRVLTFQLYSHIILSLKWLTITHCRPRRRERWPMVIGKTWWHLNLVFFCLFRILICALFQFHSFGLFLSLFLTLKLPARSRIRIRWERLE